MAAILDYATGKEDPVHMHPFFRSAASTRDPTPQPAKTFNLGLDGTSEGNDPDSVSDAEATTKPPTDALNLTPQVNALPNEARVGGSWSVAEEDELEHENNRVKRRRVSVEQVQAPQESETVNTTYATWHEQLEDAAKTLAGPGEEPDRHYPCTKDESLPQATPAAFRSADQSHMPVTSSITVEIPPLELVEHQLPQLDGAMDDPPLKRTKSTTTPKKATLQSDHGKLTFKPKSSPRRSPRSGKAQQNGEHVTKRTGKSSRQMEMKNGKFVSSLRLSLPYSAPGSGARIDEILSGKPSNASVGGSAQKAVSSSRDTAVKATHPFFLGKAAVKSHKLEPDLTAETPSMSKTSEHETNSRSSPKPKKAWKDIVFGVGKVVRQNAASLPSIWPPIALQHVHPSHNPRPVVSDHTRVRSGPSKLKQHALDLRSDEDILWNFSRGLDPDRGPSNVHEPDRKVTSGKALLKMVESALTTDNSKSLPSSATGSLKSRIETTLSCFDKGMAAGSLMWTHEYAPSCWQGVLESQSKVLYDWLKDLQVHQVQTSKLQKAKPPTPKKQRRKRKSDEMDDFIAGSDDDEDRSTASGKNAILLVGPPGSGKTASVFAVAQQLGFEVFEIHPGMRRSGRDIEDKVGDMTRNHLVQPSSTLSRESSVSIDDRAVLNHGPLPANQKTMAGFMRPKGGKQSKATETKESMIPATKAQKQSLILFEEVDILFEEDKGFWSQVQWQNRTSKRPLILTCNDPASIPLGDLNLFTVLHYGRPELEVAVQHLGHIAAVEGHLLSKEALQNLYLSKGQDLRASITELNLWCQMTVGSRQGGLDWMLPYGDKKPVSADGSATRIVSQDTYTSGLDLLPHQFEDGEDLIRFAQDSLGIDPLDWIKDDVWPNSDNISLQLLTEMLTLSDAKSALDLFHPSTAPVLAGAIRRLPSPTTTKRPAAREQIVRQYLDTLTSSQPTRTTISSAFDPLLEESRIGLPTAPGRKAPSLDNPSTLSTITDIAPYIRSIVAHDKRLEQLRSELHGSSQDGNGANKRQRRTRAARAALEGGSKGTTRRDKWFPEELSWYAVLKTGNDWPMVREDDVSGQSSAFGVGSREQTPAGTPSSSMATETEVEV